VNSEQPVFENKQFSVYSTVALDGVRNLRGALKSFLALAQPRDYLALMAYLTRSPANSAALRAMRVAARDSLKIATTVGYGPRFLHSTGQLHKGGANNVLGLQITADDTTDAAIPGASYTFGALKRAQASGDWQALQSHGRRALRVHLKRGAKLNVVAKAFQSTMKRKT